MFSSSLLNTLTTRGFIQDCTVKEDALATLFSEQKIPSAYIGFDCTASSLHVGSLMQIMVLRHLQNHGVTPIVLLGGATTKIGDPSGKDETRKPLTDEQIAINMAGIKNVFAKFLRFEGKNAAIFVNNADWWNGLKYIEVLRDIGKHFSVNRMLTMESVKLRLEREQNLSFIEFNYMILQAYDFVELHRTHKCRLQIGGSDQWGNIVSGMELARRMSAKEDLIGLTTPLLTTASGAKMGKTASGAVWLNEDLLSPYDYWQFWRNTDDADVEKFLLLFTEIDAEEIKRELTKARGTASINEWKKRLATEATKMLHGEQAALQAEETARQTFEQGGVSENLPTIKVSTEELTAGIPIHKALVMLKLAESGGEARRLVRGNAVKLNDQPISDENLPLTPTHLIEGKAKLSAGKKKHGVIVVA